MSIEGKCRWGHAPNKFGLPRNVEWVKSVRDEWFGTLFLGTYLYVQPSLTTSSAPSYVETVHLHVMSLTLASGPLFDFFLCHESFSAAWARPFHIQCWGQKDYLKFSRIVNFSYWMINFYRLVVLHFLRWGNNFSPVQIAIPVEVQAGSSMQWGWEGCTGTQLRPLDFTEQHENTLSVPILSISFKRCCIEPCIVFDRWYADAYFISQWWNISATLLQQRRAGNDASNRRNSRVPVIFSKKPASQAVIHLLIIFIIVITRCVDCTAILKVNQVTAIRGEKGGGAAVIK